MLPRNITQPTVALAWNSKAAPTLRLREWFVQVRRCDGIGRLMSQNRPAQGTTEATQKGCGTWRGRRAFPMSEYGCYRLPPASSNWRIVRKGGPRSASEPLIEQMLLRAEVDHLKR